MCDVDYSEEPATVWSETRVRARKQHVCSMCGGSIRLGQFYTRHFSVFDGSPNSEKECASCARTVQKYKDLHHGFSWVPSGMDQALEECIERELDEREDGHAQRVRMWRAELRNMERRRETRERSVSVLPSRP